MIDGHVHPAFAGVARLVERMFSRPGRGGASLAAYHHGELVLDVWSGWADAAGTRRWRGDDLAVTFSTTKGITATVLHRVVAREGISYDEPVATFWPEFANRGKEAITLRHVLTHRAGLHDVRSLVDDAFEMLDHEHMASLLAAATPHPAPGRANGYHGITFGWLVGEVLRRVTGTEVAELLRTELAEPLGLTGLFLGAPADQRDRVPALFPRPPKALTVTRLGVRADGIRRLRPLGQALLVAGFDDLVFDPQRRMLDAQMPAVNGVFDARSLAKVYGAFANGGTIDGVEVLGPETLRTVGRVQTRERDYVLGIAPRWRLGYHQAFVAGRVPPKAFGHFGYGGSGAWADPESGLSVALVVNRLGSVTTPIADARMIRLGGAALRAARERTAPTG